jgi:hypothetical protein
VLFSNCRVLRGFISTHYFEPNRPLYPARKNNEQKKVANIAIAPNQEVYILVNLIAATDLPVRRDAWEK